VKDLALVWNDEGDVRYGLDLSVTPPACVWVVEQGGKVAHLDVPELLRAVGMEDTPENRDIACEVALAHVKERYPTAQAEVV
jgi:hypothetical protein